jgi:hypothetical protein
MVQVVTRFKLDVSSQPQKAVAENIGRRVETVRQKAAPKKAKQLYAQRKPLKGDELQSAPAQPVEIDDDWKEF